MAWAYVQDNPGTLEQYDQVAELLGDDVPEGLILHVAGAHGDGVFRVIDVWESEEAFMRFRESRLRSAVEQVFGPEAMAQGPPELDPLPVHNMVHK